MDFFKKQRAARIDHYVIEVNKRIIRLEKVNICLLHSKNVKTDMKALSCILQVQGFVVQYMLNVCCCATVAATNLSAQRIIKLLFVKYYKYHVIIQEASKCQ